MGYTFAAARRRSNSSVHKVLSDFTTKFETPEEDPFFEDHMGMPDETENENELKKHDSNDSTDTASTSGSAGSLEEKD